MSAQRARDSAAAFLASVEVGDLATGAIAEIEHSSLLVRLDGYAEHPVGVVGPLALSWQTWGPLDERYAVGQRISAEVTAVDLKEGCAWLSLAATENPELWAFRKTLGSGARVSGKVAAIENFGVFVDLDEGPDHPVFPGVGFITIPELSWDWFESPHDIVAVGQRVTCMFLGFDTHLGEARLSLKILQPDPWRTFADEHAPGDVLPGTVTKVVPFGAFVRIGKQLEGLVHRDVPGGPEWDTLEPNRSVTVVVTEIDAERRRISLAWP